ncbi:RNA polymerase I-specific transcription initiation factor RRN6-like protein [Aspergillus carlsbadensis]|nr:RNA polymerase I-specific transcription initiation factor RRN6-like protein [Aspergillus carlsbadensis]
MDEDAAKPLQYGDVGKPLYHPDTQSWSFSRSLRPAPRITYTGMTKIVVPSLSTSISSSSTLDGSFLAEGYPELIPGYRLAHSPSITTVTGEACNPLTSTLLDFGYAVDIDNDASGCPSIPIVAFASGECVNAISFRTITNDKVDMLQSTMAEWQVPTIGNEDTIEWSTGGAPIRQICSSTSEDESASFVAVRSNSTGIFRPLYRRKLTSVPTHRDNNGIASGYLYSRLDPGFLVEISNSYTGGIPHADVKFNPWNENQLAIVDESGNWGIWELRHQCDANIWIAACVASGSLPWVGSESQIAGTDRRHDGWLAIEWVGDARHIVVCDRRRSVLYRLEDGQTHSSVIELGLERKSEWILGIRRSSCRSSQVFVLTTCRLLWFDATSALNSGHANLKPSVYPRLSWRHFRDSDDTTLQLTSLAVDKDFYLILFSRLSQLVLAFHCPISLEHTTNRGYASDPFILEVPPYPGDSEPLPKAVNFSTLVFKEIAPTNKGAAYPRPGLSFIKAFFLDSSLRVQESMYSKISSDPSDEDKSYGKDILHVSHQRVAGSRKQALDRLSNFIVDDWDESALGSGTSVRGVDDLASLTDSEIAFDYTQIYARVTRDLGLLSGSDEESARNGFQLSLQELMNKISGHDHPERSTGRTALEFSRKTPLLDDIDQNAQDLRQFLSRIAANKLPLGGRSHLLVHPYDPLTSPELLQSRLANVSKLDLVAIYDRLVNHWLVGLPLDIPGRARISREKAIRHFVADIVLGQIIAVRGRPETELASNSNNGDGLLPSQPIDNQNTSSEAANERSSYETTGLSRQTEDTALSSSSAHPDFTFPDHPTGTLPPFAALSAYTSFKSPGPMSRDTERILDHWKLGLDPASYSFTTEEPARLKASRRRSRKELSMSMNTLSIGSSVPLPAASSPVRPARDWGSQPDNNSQPPTVRLQSSQVTEDLPMTQIERGAFGGRETVKKSVIKAKKKKRAAGF